VNRTYQRVPFGLGIEDTFVNMKGCPENIQIPFLHTWVKFLGIVISRCKEYTEGTVTGKIDFFQDRVIPHFMLR
jgi:hypothetical protein